jgi:hypothetical protein
MRSPTRSPNRTNGTRENQEWAKKSRSARNEDQADTLLSRAGKENDGRDPARARCSWRGNRTDLLARRTLDPAHWLTGARKTPSASPKRATLPRDRRAEKKNPSQMPSWLTCRFEATKTDQVEKLERG